MWVQGIDPVLLELFGLEIRWYGLVYVLGFLLAYWYLLRKRQELGISKDEASDLIFYLMLGVIIGARLIHVLVWEPAYYFSQPWKILFLWEGGMAFHGGLLGGIIAALWFCQKKKIPFLRLADILSIPAVIALAFGRLANFVNSELYGPFTSLPWCVDFGDGCRHPYQLYAALKRFLVAGILFWIGQKKNHRDGFIFWMMLLLLSLGRFLLDFWRIDTIFFGLAPGQWLSLFIAIISSFVLWTKYLNKE